MEIANDLSSENPKIVDVFADGGAGELDLDQMTYKRTKTIDELFTGGNVFGEAHPSVGPFMEIFAAWKLIERKNGWGPVWGVSWGRSFLLTLLDNHGTDYDSKPVLPFLGISV